MTFVAALFGFILVCFILWEGFETIVLPRSVTRNLRLTRLLYQNGWVAWKWMAKRIPHGDEALLGYFGPLSLILLLTVWAMLLILGFGLLQWSQGQAFTSPGHIFTLETAIYLSGTTLFTLGFGDVTPLTGITRWIAVSEAGVGFGFLAVVIGYFPTLYQAFSRREVTISMLDARASTPPTALELLRRYADAEALPELGSLLRDWEQWSAELLESHLSYPILAYYRSQHDGESWLSALTAILDTCALISLDIDGTPKAQAHLTFAMARHTIVDLALVFDAPPKQPETDRLPSQDWERLREMLDAAGVPIQQRRGAEQQLAEFRRMYEPYVYSLSQHFLLPLPPWIAPVQTADNWQNSAWEHGPGTHLL